VTHVSIFRPKILGTDTPTFISAVGTRGAAGFENTSESTVHQMNGSGGYSGFQLTDRARFIQYTGTYSLAITPSTIIDSTPVVTIKGTFTNVFIAGCAVTFEAVYDRRAF
jgi:hypothetical protein